MVWMIRGGARRGGSTVGTILKSTPPPCDLCRLGSGKPSAFLLSLDSAYRATDIHLCRDCLVGLRIALHDAESEG